MHVHHLRPLLLPASTPAPANAARKKSDENSDKVEPVERRFSDEEAEEERRRQKSWRDLTEAPADADDEAEATNFYTQTAAAPPSPPAEPQPVPLAVLFAGLGADKTPEAAPAEPAGQAEPAEKASLDDLLALMRAASRST